MFGRKKKPKNTGRVYVSSGRDFKHVTRFDEPVVIGSTKPPYFGPAKADTTSNPVDVTYLDVHREYIPEVVVPGKRLGRHIHTDARSAQFLVEADNDAQSVTWARYIPILDQGDLGSCTGNAATGALGSAPVYATLSPTVKAALNESFAVSFYSAEEKADGGAGYPPEDEGSSGLTAGKVAKSDGYIPSYLHATTVAAAQTAIKSGPLLIGSDWHTGMDNPTSTGLVKPTGTVRGGHEYLCREYDADADLWWCDNSWGTSFGVQGRFCYSSSTLATLLAAGGDVVCFQAAVTPAPTPITPTPVIVADAADLAVAPVLEHILTLSSTSAASKVAIDDWLEAKGL